MIQNRDWIGGVHALAPAGDFRSTKARPRGGHWGGLVGVGGSVAPAHALAVLWPLDAIGRRWWAWCAYRPPRPPDGCAYRAPPAAVSGNTGPLTPGGRFRQGGGVRVYQVPRQRIAYRRGTLASRTGGSPICEFVSHPPQPFNHPNPFPPDPAEPSWWWHPCRPWPGQRPDPPRGAARRHASE